MESLGHLAERIRWSSSRVFATVGLAVCVGGQALANPNLVVNGGFETGDFTGWSLTGNSTFFDFVECPGVGFVPEGSCDAAFGPLGSDDTLSQVVSTPANMGNYISFYFSSDGGTPGHFSVTFGGRTLYDVTDPPLTPYEPLSFLVFFNDAGPRTLAFNFRDDPGYIHLDGVSVTVPEPATIGLLAIGLSGLAFGRRRKVR